MIACFNSLRLGGDGWREKGLGWEGSWGLKARGEKRMPFVSVT